MGSVEIVVTALVALGSAAVGAGIVWAIHLRQQRSQIRDRLRLAYVDFFASVDKMKISKIKLIEDERLFVADKLEASRFDTSAREFLDTTGGHDRAIYMIRLLEEEQEFVQEVQAVSSKCGSMMSLQDPPAVLAASDTLVKDVHRLITRITETHPLLRIARPFVRPRKQ